MYSMHLDKTLAALADPTRRAILQKLSHGEMRVTRIAQPFSISLNSVSRHIRMLEKAGLVKRRRAGKEHLLSLDTRTLDEAGRWINEHYSLWTKRLDALETHRSKDHVSIVRGRGGSER